MFLIYSVYIDLFYLIVFIFHQQSSLLTTINLFHLYVERLLVTYLKIRPTRDIRGNANDIQTTIEPTEEVSINIGLMIGCERTMSQILIERL